MASAFLARPSRAESVPPPIRGQPMLIGLARHASMTASYPPSTYAASDPRHHGFPVRRPRSSDRFGNLRGMADDEATLATVVDRDGREVVLLARIWEQKITLDHPELAGHLEAVMETVAHPDHVEADGLPARTRFYRRDVGPSRWLLAVVSYEQQPGRIITALANRKDPKQWTP
jgi:hypothetical protein